MDDNDTSWPAREPERWHGTDLTRNQARTLIDELDARDFPSLINQLDEVQAQSEDGAAFLLIRIVDR
jgi:hypothetical protein